MKGTQTIFRLFLLTTMILSTAGCSSSGDDDDDGGKESNEETTPITEQINGLTLNGLTTRLSLTTADKEGLGFIVVTTLDVIGVKTITGENDNVSIDLDTPVNNGDTLTVTLYDDTDANGSFNIASDLPAQDIGGSNIELIETISVPAGTPDVRLTMTANGTSSWSVDAEPATYTDWGNVGIGDNPAITILTSGVRFEVVNPAYLVHPFSLINTATGTTELITQTRNAVPGAGTFFNDTNVNVTENAGTIQFTLTGALLAEVDTYRCDIHVGSMVGTFGTP